MKISVVIPTYNNAGSITQTVGSVLRQKHGDLEVIVVNDGGTSPRDVLPMQDARLRLIEHPENVGVSEARNIGWADATGDLVFFLDSDDVAGAGLFTYAASAFSSVPEMDALLLGRADVQDETVDGAAVLPDPPLPAHPAAPVPLEMNRFCQMMEHRTGRFIPSAVFLRSASVRTEFGAAPWLRGLAHNQDTLFFLECAALGLRYFEAPDPWIVYRRHGSSMSQRGQIDRFSDRIRSMDYLLSQPAIRDPGREVHRTAKRMRHSAARRVARLHRQSGARGAAFACLMQDLRAGPTLKTLLALFRF